MLTFMHVKNIFHYVCILIMDIFLFILQSFSPLISPAHSVLRETNLITLVCYLFFFLRVLIPYCELGIVLIISQSPAYIVPKR